ncbi:MAG: type II CRISPR RNA-guided endonuclease Cas9 [Prevotellaceae bacterium]|jgi:CRISPR-associated endonuclease Csn1|nr:type II CRISPR RNA-guided endonuclease Cas9 [Prevotellaceae bacterium]
MKTVLGLDLGTNSIGWAVVEKNEKGYFTKISGAGSRIIPMAQDILGNFDAGNSVSQTAERTGLRGMRRLRERYLLRRERLHRVLHLLGFLPEHYDQCIDFETRLGKFIQDVEPKLPWRQAADGKMEFLFQKSFNEMVADFKKNQPQLFFKKPNGEEAKIPYDWTIYYLRKKALQQKIEKEELAWILLNFNQKRGYYQLRGEDEEENANKLIEYRSLKIVDVIADEKPNSKGETWYSLHLETGWIYRRASKTALYDWKNTVRDFIITTELNDDGTVKTDKDGNEKRSFRAPKEEDWTLLKKKTEADIEQSHKTVGTYIYDTLLQNPSQKIRGKLVRTIERKFYKEELVAILKKQVALQPDLFGEDLYNECIRELYKSNEAYQFVLSKRDFVHLFVNDIIFYQRPLRSQKSLISNCKLEFRKYTDKEGNEIIDYLKGTPKSNPLYQEYRVWQWLFNLKIYKKDDGTDVTAQFLSSKEDWENLFEFLMQKKEVNHKDILQYFFTLQGLKGKTLSSEIAKYRWNYVFDDSQEKEDDKSKKYPCNETSCEIRRRLEKVENTPTDFLTPEVEQKLWHIIYSVTDRVEFEKALNSFAEKHGLDAKSFVENFKKFPPFKNEYASFSEKAIRKLLPLMRLGKYWSWEAIDATTKDRIAKIISGEYDETIKDRVREKAIHLTTENDFQGLQLWLAQYIVYDRHSEASVAGKWSSVADLENYLEDFRQHSLRNPIVEQVIMETLRVIRDIWQQYGKGAKDFFNEIHVELGREMKHNTEDRKSLTIQALQHENTNLRIKALLVELQADGKIENVRPYSPVQQEILKIYEDGVIRSGIEIPDDILKISKTAQPSTSDLQRYKLWLEQKYRSPYTGAIIPLSKLFTSAYEIEHIIPQSRYFDDSFNNKVICESAVNKLKDKQLGLEFIKNHHGEKVQVGSGKTVEIFSEEAYQKFVKEYYLKSGTKRKNLLLEEIPEKMITRQMNDTRYISRFISSVLSSIVRAETKDDGVNSKNVVLVNGKITGILKQDWGLNDVWNDLILPRFERMNYLTNSTTFTAWNEKHQKYLPTVPLELSKGFQRKRIDHRHHTADAIIIACATIDHVNYLNNENAHKKEANEKGGFRNDLREKLCTKTKTDNKGNYKWQFNKPWDTFTQDVRAALENIIVSFKQNLRVINKTTNKYQIYENGKKILKPQEKGDSWAIRKQLHKDTVFAKVSLRKTKKVRLNVALKDWKNIVNKELKNEIKRLIAAYGLFDAEKINRYFKDKKYLYQKVDISKVDVYYFEDDNAASRKPLDTSFNAKAIESITDIGIQKILLNHLAKKENNPDLAFSPEGIEEMNQKIVELNEGKPHQPIYKVRVYEPIGSKFPVGYVGNKKTKYVEAAKGTNLFFAIYADETGNRTYETIPLNIIIDNLKNGLPPVKERNQDGHSLLFYLSPNDLVYVPTKDEVENQTPVNIKNIRPNRVYKMVSCTGNQCFFVPNNIANPIVHTAELGANNKAEKAWDGVMIKQACFKVICDRLGKIEKCL